MNHNICFAWEERFCLTGSRDMEAAGLVFIFNQTSSLLPEIV